jgi:putative chitinase
MISREQFARLFPGLTPSKQEPYKEALVAAMEEYGITSSQRIAAFLAQIGHETAGLHYLQELGGEEYFKRYDGRKDLGNAIPGDGARFHGRGMIQLTGRANYREFGGLLGLDLEGNPDQAAEPEVGARIAALFWDSRGCNELADADRFEAITRKINGGVNGLQDRLRRWEIARAVLGLPRIVA